MKRRKRATSATTWTITPSGHAALAAYDAARAAYSAAMSKRARKVQR